jgi:hypothetical protein
MARLGRTQKAIIEHLRSNGGASNSYAIAKSCSRCHSGENFVLRSLHRLYERGVVKYASGTAFSRLTEREKAAVVAAQARSPRASVFWVLAEDWL